MCIEYIHLSCNSDLQCMHHSPLVLKSCQKEVKGLGACLRKPAFSTFFIFHCTEFLKLMDIFQDEKVQHPCKFH